MTAVLNRVNFLIGETWHSPNGSWSAKKWKRHLEWKSRRWREKGWMVFGSKVNWSEVSSMAWAFRWKDLFVGRDSVIGKRTCLHAEIRYMASDERLRQQEDEKRETPRRTRRFWRRIRSFCYHFPVQMTWVLGGRRRKVVGGGSKLKTKNMSDDDDDRTGWFCIKQTQSGQRTTV